MSGRKYPLHPLVDLRAKQVDEAARDLAKAVDARQTAERAREAAEAARVRAEEKARALREEERVALDQGMLRAGDLHRAQAWEIGVSEERKKLVQQAVSAQQGEQKAREKEDGARGNLAEREADAEVVEKDEAKFVAREQKRELAKEEEAAAEAWRPKR